MSVYRSRVSLGHPTLYTLLAFILLSSTTLRSAPCSGCCQKVYCIFPESRLVRAGHHSHYDGREFIKRDLTSCGCDGYTFWALLILRCTQLFDQDPPVPLHSCLFSIVFLDPPFARCFKLSLPLCCCCCTFLSCCCRSRCR